MKSVPQMISTKDLLYICDMFEWMMTAAKKANHFCNEVQDDEIKDVLTQVVEVHAKHCQTLIDILSEGGEE